ncbi:MAG: class I SAM-dependent methyltransferase [Candidatus Omnitrophota bacterium]
MKPFIRLSEEMRHYFKDKKIPDFIWDFDYFLLNILSRFLRSILTADEINRLSIEQWKVNLSQFCKSREMGFKKLLEGKASYPFHIQGRNKILLDNLKKGSSFLYIGCGSGTQCLQLAYKGLDVTGIDTYKELVDIGNKYARHLDLPFKAIHMNFNNIGFKPKSFDGLAIECYGSLPSLNSRITLQRNLASILKDTGIGFLSAARKKYWSYFYARDTHPSSLTEWLSSQEKLDFLYSEKDSSEETLLCGLYYRNYTAESLSNELSHSFEVLECSYERYDPRYVLAKVRPKKNVTPFNPQEMNKEPTISDKDIGIIKNILLDVEKLCDMLESHDNNVIAFFNNEDEKKLKNPLIHVKIDIREILDKLMNIKGKIPPCVKENIA